MTNSASRTYNVHQAKTHLSKLLERTADGEEIIIARAGVPVARLVPIVAAAAERPLGSERGTVLIADDFDAPLPADLLAAFEQ
ncbi:MAG: type II toxin-antitoxin system Phd/YefM family antitoxin [Gemmatimonadales bacterium]|nr:type II toxin-antitoxin system Phd/YefM family antitoxin [Gemmatimonadales bacterium]MDZ4388140.1 type II toxin-antitoxin system Phd/YefM family antitoxin [Gemmatimonadales bacterium]